MLVIVPGRMGMVNQVDHRASVTFRPMPIVTREAVPEDYAEAGRITAEAIASSSRRTTTATGSGISSG
jgi:hypothetical protein